MGRCPPCCRSTWPVYCWIPNILTYIRLAACIRAFTVAFTDKREFAFLYSICFVTEHLSKHIAKQTNTTSTYGDVLAHVCARASNTGLLIVLSHLYKKDYRVFLLLLEIEIVSHWLKVYCEVMSKRCPCMHLPDYQKAIYQNTFFRFFCALSQETMCMTLYLVAFDWMEHDHPIKLEFLRDIHCTHAHFYRSLSLSMPGYILKQLATFDEIRLAADMCLHFDEQKHCHVAPAALPQHLELVVHKKHPRRRTRSRSKDYWRIEKIVDVPRALISFQSQHVEETMCCGIMFSQLLS